MMKCSYCGRPDQESQCTGCGAPIPDVSVTESLDRYCHQCGAICKPEPEGSFDSRTGKAHVLMICSNVKCWAHCNHFGHNRPRGIWSSWKKCLNCGFLFLICLFLSGCAVPPDEAKVGDYVQAVYVHDARTGNCIKIFGYDKVQYIVVDPAECKRINR